VTVGFPLGQAEINARAGALAVGLRDVLRQCSDFCDLLQNTQVIANDQVLLNMGYSQAEVNTLRAAFTDAKALRQIALGLATQPAANNFLFNLQKLMGSQV